MRPLYFWLIIAGLTLVLELVSPAFLFVCFTGGALAAALSTLWIDGLTLQAVVFALVSVILIPLSRPIARKMSRAVGVESNVDALVGKTGYVLEEIDATRNVGRIRIGSEEWRAVADTVIPVQSEVTVARVEGTTLTVTPRS